MKKTPYIALSLVLLANLLYAQLKYANDVIKTGAEQTERYIDKLKGKRVALVANQTSVIGSTHLLDSLLKRGVTVAKVFGPEHGFRGNASNGTEVSDEVDSSTGVKVISLYGKKNKPSKEDLADVDILVFDIQDVGCRFYTNINTLRDVMESCSRYGKELMILDRPNPNAYLIDGPILDMNLKSGIGQFPIPISHGLTVAEFAQMVNGEGWLADNLKCKLSIVKNANYRHDMLYKLPVNPSPNLNTEAGVLLYPSTCLFEGVALNHGRGTDYPFTVIGGPMLKGMYDFSYIPISMPGRAEDPLYQDQTCYGLDLRNSDLEKLVESQKINLAWMIELYSKFPNKAQFFDRSVHRQIGNIDHLAGVSEFRKQIEAGKSEAEIRETWESDLVAYRKMRKKYLLYK
ncbi:exo-beta-N-acetylmuramidase NamZ domain-containing protein [Parapedobacter deserti]|uniref:Exo-beta-N-acetylmuramidase NamZ domain-containing protein n=1 Tax=Parapedobacter deserti TaxID=1912957 RepID=A0ABV7JMK3_9SPHI